MAGFSGKTAWISGAKQSAKGTPATTSIFKNAFAGGNIGPRRETDQLAETDTARDQGAAYATVGGVEGSPEIYARDASIGWYLAAVLGGVAAPTGTTPNFVHTITPSQALAYHTFWRNVGGTASGVIERFEDCVVSGLSFSADAGSPLTATANIMGLASVPIGAETASPAAMDKAQVHNFNLATVTLGGSATRKVSSFNLSIENNVTTQQTNSIIPWDWSPGNREIDLSFDMIFDDITEYKNFNYAGGTAISPVIYTTSAVFLFTLGANNYIQFTLPSVAYMEYPVEPDASGGPVVVSIKAVAQPATGVPNLLSCELKNQVVTYV